MFNLTRYLAILTIFGYVSLESVQAKWLPGPCPKFKPFDLDMNKLEDISFKLLYGEKSDDGLFCIENKFTEFDEGVNLTRWQLNSGSRIA